jgi:hypothetical protein
MKRAATFVLLSLVVLVLAVLVTRFRTDHERPSVNLPTPESEPQPVDQHGHVIQQPTILRAKPADDETGNWSTASPRHWPTAVRPVTPESDPLEAPLESPFQFNDSLSPAVPSLPVNNVAPQWGSVLPDAENSNAAIPLEQSPEQAVEANEKPRSQLAPVEPDVPPRRVFTNENDSLWRISERVYGHGGYFKALYELNRLRVHRPDRLPRGIEILTPPASELRRLLPASCPPESE